MYYCVWECSLCVVGILSLQTCQEGGQGTLCTFLIHQQKNIHSYSIEGKKCNQIYGIITPHSTMNLFGIGNGELFCHFREWTSGNAHVQLDSTCGNLEFHILHTYACSNYTYVYMYSDMVHFTVAVKHQTVFFSQLATLCALVMSNHTCMYSQRCTEVQRKVLHEQRRYRSGLFLTIIKADFATGDFSLDREAKV